MPCDTQFLPNETLSERKSSVKKTIDELAQALKDKKVTPKIGPQGAIFFDGWTNRNRVTDACAYRRIMAGSSPAAKKAIMLAEQKAGIKVDRLALAHGHHSHDGKTWHHGH